MKSLDFSRYALTSCVAAAMLAGCGGSQPPIGAPGAVAQTSAISTHAAHGKSWMLPEAKGEDLLYAGNILSDVNVFSYPSGKLVGVLAESAYSLCSDKNGHIFLTEPTGTVSTILEYAHGGTKLIQTLNDGNALPHACSVDPTTGNLAVINLTTDGLQGPGDIAIYQGARGTPELYSDSDITEFWSGSYDEDGNLLVDNASCCIQFAVLPKDGTALTNVTLNGQNVPDPGTLQWDGKNFVVGEAVGQANSTKLSVIKLTGSSGSVAKSIRLRGLKVTFASLHGNVAIAFFGGRREKTGFWHYPDGGKLFETLDGRRAELGFTGATVSRARH